MAAKDTTPTLQKLRSLMKNTAFVNPSINAYIIPSGDAHSSEYIDASDARCAFVSGFTGSEGIAIVTESKAATWTEGRYFLQAEAQMDGNWRLMKIGLAETPSLYEWLCKELPSNGRVGVDFMLISHEILEPLSEQLLSLGHSVVSVEKNLVDAVWDDRPARPVKPVMVHPIKYSGQPWQEKVKTLRSKMKKKQVDALVVSALDEIAWLLNLRGFDISFNPVFFSFVIVSFDSIMFFIDEVKLPKDARVHLNLDSSDSSQTDMKVILRPYDAVRSDLETLASKLDRIWVSSNSSEALFSAVNKHKRLSEPSPIAILKAVKNETEIAGMRSAHVKDAVALSNFFSWLEKNIETRQITELDACEISEKFHQEQEDYVGLSYATIAASGSNGSIIHYQPSPETNKPITKDEIFLFDSHAHYRSE